MMRQTLSWSADLSTPLAVAAVALAVLSLALLAWELRRSRGKSAVVALSGAIATALMLAAVLRPVRVSARVTQVGPKIAVLVDRSVSMALPGDGAPRWLVARQAMRDLRDASPDARWTVRGFGTGAASEFDTSSDDDARNAPRSDLVAALDSLTVSSEEMPAAVVVISDGRLDRPSAQATGEALRTELGSPAVPVHTVAVAHGAPSDASIRSVHAAGAAVAHQPFALRIEVGCVGLPCDAIPVHVSELVESGPAVRLASGVAPIVDGTGMIELPVTLDRAGKRVVKIEIASPPGDEIPDNDTRLLTFDVARDRVRVLHVAGSPTYDVRALRMWLKSDASLDVVAFFILRSLTDDVNASNDDLALIKFPVDELFSEHLQSFDAVVLQSFNALPYGLSSYLENLARYVERGGGLIMVGGQDAFASGGYAGTPLERVLPVALPEADAPGIIDTSPFVPAYSSAGREVPVLAPLRALLGTELPSMSGTNVVGDPHPGTVVLWEHPTRRTRSGGPMPVLAVGETGNGRSVALTIDDAHRLAFSESALKTSGRAFGALWDGLLGWLMRDPRFEPASIEVAGGCRAGAPVRLVVRTLPGVSGEMELRLAMLGSDGASQMIRRGPPGSARQLDIDVPELASGGYAATLRFGDGPSTVQDFACERGGDEWADSRPDPDRLDHIAQATGGRSVPVSDVRSLSFPKAMEVASERRSSPLLPPWVWTAAASLMLGLHWIARRKFGLY
jgi:uncharacterized membrane protein